MTEDLNPAEISDRIDLPNGDAIVLVNRLGKDARYSKEYLASNVFRVGADGHARWQIQSQFDAEGNPFTRLHYDDGKITAYRWDGGSYGIDIETGAAIPLMLER